jgi:hypothetical protein
MFHCQTKKTLDDSLTLRYCLAYLTGVRQIPVNLPQSELHPSQQQPDNTATAKITRPKFTTKAYHGQDEVELK